MKVVTNMWIKCLFVYFDKLCNSLFSNNCFVIAAVLEF